MLACKIAEGALFYGETRRREVVPMTSTLRKKTTDMIALMHQYDEKGYTPPPRPSKGCNACSLKELCLPHLVKAKTVQEYIRLAIEGTP